MRWVVEAGEPLLHRWRRQGRAPKGSTGMTWPLLSELLALDPRWDASYLARREVVVFSLEGLRVVAAVVDLVELEAAGPLAHALTRLVRNGVTGVVVLGPRGEVEAVELPPTG